MKLFTKTLLFFISVIVFQSGLTIFLTTNLTRRSNLEDAQKQLISEAALVGDNYASWKRGIWKSLLAMHADRHIADFLRQPPPKVFPTALLEQVQARLADSGVDLVVLQQTPHPTLEILPLTSNNFSFAELRALTNQKTHPYITLDFVGNQLCLIGITRLHFTPVAPDQAAEALDFFIIKRIDQDFCAQLILNRNAHIAFFLDTRYLSGTLPAARARQSVARVNWAALPHQWYQTDPDERRNHIAIQKIEKLRRADRDAWLFLVTLVSNAPYRARLTTLAQTLFSVTALSALLTILLSLFLSQQITGPIKLLHAAMQRLRQGQYDATLTLRAQNEIGELVQGFHAMARDLREDQATLKAYIHEITVLKDYNEHILHSIGAGMLIVNPQLQVEKVNAAFLAMFHVTAPELLGNARACHALEIFDAAARDAMQAILQQRRTSFTKIKRTANRNVYEINLYPITSHDDARADGREVLGCVCIVEDMTQKMALEEKIFQAEKLSSIGMLSAGVAHEINNPLGSIMTNVQNLLEDETDPEKSVALGWIEQETRRIARIVQKLLEFSSADVDPGQGSDVNQVIRDTVTLLTYSLKKTQQLTIATELADDLPLAAIAPDELKQTLMNLVKNALQAMLQSGTIVIRTQRDEAPPLVQISVADTGRGIKAEDLPHIFDPFFTTKNNGEGTGLGLSIVYGIVNKYHGKISVVSEEGQGTQVLMAFPPLSAQAAAIL